MPFAPSSFLLPVMKEPRGAFDLKASQLSEFQGDRLQHRAMVSSTEPAKLHHDAPLSPKAARLAHLNMAAESPDSVSTGSKCQKAKLSLRGFAARLAFAPAAIFCRRTSKDFCKSMKTSNLEAMASILIAMASTERSCKSMKSFAGYMEESRSKCAHN